MKPGKRFGVIAFYNIIISILITYIIIVTAGVREWQIETDLLLKLVSTSNGVFLTVWGVVFGSGAIKKWKGTE